jgi:uncharacterized protein (TIGR03382 family)
MTLNLRIVLTSFAFCAMLGWSAANGATILKLSLGSTGADLAMNGSGVLGTMSDGVAATTGDQNTAIDFTGFLDGSFADVTTNDASFTLAGLQKTGPLSIIGGTVIAQDFLGGTFSLYSPTNSLLLSGNLQGSTLTGSIGGTATGSLFTTNASNFTGGSLLPNLQANTLNISMTLTNVSNGTGFVVSGAPFVLQPFTADTFVNITAEPIPEPASIAIALLGAAGFGLLGRRRTNRYFAK